MRPTRYPYQKIPMSDTTKVLDVIHSLELLSMDFSNFKELTEIAQQPVRKLVECYINNLKGIYFEVVPTSLKLRLHEQLEFFGYALELLEHGQDGYFLPRTEEEKIIGLAPYKKQITTSAGVVKAVESVDLKTYWS